MQHNIYIYIYIFFFKKKTAQISFHTYKKNKHIKLVSFIKNWRKKETYFMELPPS